MINKYTLTCRCKFELWANPFLQKEQIYGLAPVCIRTWIIRWPRWVYLIVTLFINSVQVKNSNLNLFVKLNLFIYQKCEKLFYNKCRHRAFCRCECVHDFEVWFVLKISFDTRNNYRVFLRYQGKILKGQISNLC